MKALAVCRRTGKVEPKVVGYVDLLLQPRGGLHTAQAFYVSFVPSTYCVSVGTLPMQAVNVGLLQGLASVTTKLPVHSKAVFLFA